MREGSRSSLTDCPRCVLIAQPNTSVYPETPSFDDRHTQRP